MSEKVSLHAQASAVDVALSAFRSRTMPKLRQSELDMIKRSLRAASLTLLMINATRDHLPADLVSKCEDAS